MSVTSAKELLDELLSHSEKREKNGYTQVFWEGEWQWLHRVIAKEKMGAEIYDGFEVHHIDGDKQNNHPDNLKVLSKEEHQALHEDQRDSKSNTEQDIRSYISDRIKHLHSGRKIVAGNASDQNYNVDSSKELASILSIMRRHSFLSEFREMETFDDVCMRCGGTGYLPEYNHVEGGVCFACGGSGRG